MFVSGMNTDIAELVRCIRCAFKQIADCRTYEGNSCMISDESAINATLFGMKCIESMNRIQIE